MINHNMRPTCVIACAGIPLGIPVTFKESYYSQKPIGKSYRLDKRKPRGLVWVCPWLDINNDKVLLTPSFTVEKKRLL